MTGYPDTITEEKYHVYKACWSVSITTDKILTRKQYGAALPFIIFHLFLRPMYFSVCNFLRLLQRSSLLAIYTAFFLVQFLCFTGRDNTIVSTTSPTYHNESGKQKAFTTKNDRSKKTKIRLNKRFQPPIADIIVNPIAELPVKYIHNNNPVKPKEYLLISFVLAESLRGPPSLS